MADVHAAVRANSKACLLAPMPSSKIFNPMATFASKEELGELSNLVSSGGVSIWKEGDPVHLTETAYGDIAEHLIKQGDCIAGAEVPRRRLESVVTRSAADPAHTPLPGWLVGGNQGAQRGRGQARGAPGGFSYNRGRGAGRGKPAQWRGGPGGRWAPY